MSDLLVVTKLFPGHELGDVTVEGQVFVADDGTVYLAPSMRIFGMKPWGERPELTHEHEAQFRAALEDVLREKLEEKVR